jgi:hypothetical protein
MFCWGRVWMYEVHGAVTWCLVCWENKQKCHWRRMAFIMRIPIITLELLLLLLLLLLLSSSSIGTTTLSWVSACSTVVEHSQQEGFTECRWQRHVKRPTWRRTRDLERSNFRHKRPPASEATLANPAAEGGNMGEKWPRNFAESGDFHFTFGFFYMP